MSTLVIALSCLSTTAHADLRVVTTTTDLRYFVQRIGGDKVHVDAVCQGAQDPHFVQARPSYMVMLSRADMLVSVGLELEVGWLPSLITGARNPTINPGKPGYFEAGSAIKPIDIPHGHVDRSHGDVHPLGNPHHWLDPENVKLIVHALAQRMAKLDADNAKLYLANAAAFQQHLTDKLKQWSAKMVPYNGAKIASYHATFNYFHQRFGLQGIGYLEDRPGIPPSPAHLVELIKAMREAGVRVIFHEAFYDHATSENVAARSGAKVLKLPTSVGGVRGVDTYEQLIDYLVDRFVAALKKGKP